MLQDYQRTKSGTFARHTKSTHKSQLCKKPALCQRTGNTLRCDTDPYCSRPGRKGERQQLRLRFTKEEVQELTENADEFFHDQEIADSQLRMIFACCRPSLKQEDRVALTLQIVSAFSMPEIARALLTNEAVVQKRLFRAKKMLREKKFSWKFPPDEICGSDCLNSIHTRN